MVGLAFDIGFLEMMNRQAQTAADAGAIAGAVGLPYSNSTASARAATAKNGFTNNTNGATVLVNNPPTKGPNAGNSQFVEVIVSQAEPTFFLKMIGAPSTTNVTVRAVATNLAGDCIFALNPTAGPSGSIQNNSTCPNCTAALFVGGNSLINVSGCSVQVDSTTNGSLWLEWGNLYTNYMGDSAAEYKCGTGYADVGPGDPGCYDPSYDNVTMYPQPSTPLSDPLAYLSPPGSTSCTSGGTVLIYGSTYSTGGTGSQSNPYTYNITPGSGSIPSCPDIVITQACPGGASRCTPTPGFTNTTFNPGTYHSITMGSGYCCYEGEYVDPVLPNYPIVNFQPGVYSVLGSVPLGPDSYGNYYCISYWWSFNFGANNNCGVSLLASNATIQNTSSTGETFYVGPSAGGASIDGCWGGYFINGFIGCGPNNVNLAATTTAGSSYAGILFYQDRSNSNNACFGGCSNYPTATPTNTFIIAGAMYFPDAGLYFSGCCQGPNASNTYQISVAQTLNFYFDNFYSDYASLPGGSPIKKTSLTE
jgi:hypothetical protein